MTPCLNPACDQPAHPKRKGYCRSCYMRLYRYGSLEPRRTPTRVSAAFMADALASETDECIPWPYGRNGEYPYFRGGSGHVYVCERAHGPRPDGAEAAHSCGVSLCINPRHLRWATGAENWSDRIGHGTASRGSLNPVAKLTEADVVDIRERVARGEKQVDVAVAYGVTKDAISKIVRGRNWKHVTPPAT